MKETQIQSFMTKDVFHIPSHTCLFEAVGIMRDKGFSCLIITDDRTPIGIITERDMVNVLASLLEDAKFRSMDVNSVMVNRPLSIKGDTSVLDALKLAKINRIRHLPVVDDSGYLSGLVTYSDMVRNKMDVLETHDEVVEQSVIERTKGLQQDKEALLSLALEDPLLEIGNRRAMEIDMHQHHEASFRHKLSYSVALLDIDHFKNYNDFYGHSDGDSVLRAVVAEFKSCIRDADRLYRYGGEEFLLLLPETPIEGAMILINRVVSSLRNAMLPHEKSPVGFVTVSAGLASYCPEGAAPSWQQLITEADVALYQAKENGRNQCIASQISVKEKDLGADRPVSH